MKYRALRVYQPGTEFKLSLEEEAAKALMEGEVRLRITSIGLNRADLLSPQNRYFIKPEESSRIGFEGAGEVIETAAESRVTLLGILFHFPGTTGGIEVGEPIKSRCCESVCQDNRCVVVGDISLCI